jgi:hypothetical protein
MSSRANSVTGQRLDNAPRFDKISGVWHLLLHRHHQQARLSKVRHNNQTLI